LTAAERRNLAITFVGGLGSIVAGAVVIGGAIALFRVVAPDPHKIQWWAVGVVNLVLVGYLGGLYLGRSRLKGGLRVILLGLAVLMSALVILLWVGLVAKPP